MADRFEDKLDEHVEAERFRGLEVSDELELRGLDDRQVGRLLAIRSFVPIARRRGTMLTFFLAPTETSRVERHG